ncbi:zinc finger protein 385B-like [Scleropages formosus]|uniref:zinc finger protein 385B-like n=1 Tax=Scleropages formosus TaxID=113540 RepID=UPI0010FAACA3|nr:zinc finger protein 385B-like [Scleropages formosus]
MKELTVGSPVRSNSVLPSAQSPPPMMKPFLSFSVDNSSPAELFPYFNTMDPVQKAVISHTFGVSIPMKKKQVISCGICQLHFNSESQAEAHYKGSKHAKKLKLQESAKSKARNTPTKDSMDTVLSPGPGPAPGSGSVLTMAAVNSSHQAEWSTANSAIKPTTPSAGMALVAMVAAPCPPKSPSEPTTASSPKEKAIPETGTRESVNTLVMVTPLNAPAATFVSEEEKAKKLLYCSLCKVAVNSLLQLEAHNTGLKHKMMLEARNGAGPIKAYPRLVSKVKFQATVVKGSGLQNKTFHCEICDVHVNSEIQLKQHISSRRHKGQVAGKPLKPKYSPYSKQQRSSSATLSPRVAFQKELVNPMSSAFVSNQFGPIPLQPQPADLLFQTTTMPAPFLEPSPGSIVLAPY